MSSYATKFNELFNARVLKQYYQQFVTPMITNKNYEGEMKGKATILNVLTFNKLTLKNYTGASLSLDDLTESNCQLKTDQQKYYYFRVLDIDTLKSYIKNPKSQVIEQLVNEFKEVVDKYVLTFWRDAGAGNHYGTDYTTGTVTVDVTTGAVTGVGTTFTSSMVGKSFKAAGHTEWYRVKSYASATSIVIEDDKDDEDSAYTGGAISAGATYVIQAVSAIQITKDNIYSVFLEMKAMLDRNKVKKDGRFATVDADVETILLQAPQLTQAVESNQDTIKNGKLGRMAGFTIYSSEQSEGNIVNGVHCLFGVQDAITFAQTWDDQDIEEKIHGNFGSAYKGLMVYGAKVADVNRKALAHGYFKK